MVVACTQVYCKQFSACYLLVEWSVLWACLYNMLFFLYMFHYSLVVVFESETSFGFYKWIGQCSSNKKTTKTIANGYNPKYWIHPTNNPTTHSSLFTTPSSPSCRENTKSDRLYSQLRTSYTLNTYIPTKGETRDELWTCRVVHMIILVHKFSLYCMLSSSCVLVFDQKMISQ